RRTALSRRRAAPPVHLLSPGPAGDAADRARAADRVGPHRQADRARLPGERQRHGAAHHAGEESDRPRRGGVRGARRGRARRAPGRMSGAAAWICLVSNEGHGAGGAGPAMRLTLAAEAIRLARLLLRLFPAEPEVMGLAALLLLQHARTPARFDADGAVVLLEDQDRSRWDGKLIAEGLALIDKAVRHKRRGPYQVQAAIAALHARAARPEDSDWAQIDLLYAALESLQPSPVITLNRAVAVPKVRRPAAALEMLEPLAPRRP